MMALLPFLGFIWKLAKLSIPIPLGIIAVLGLSYQFLLPLKIRSEVQKRVTEMVTQAEKQSLQAQLAASAAREKKSNELLQIARKRGDIIADANKRLQDQISEDGQYEREQTEKQKDIDLDPIGNGYVTPAIMHRLRNNR